MTISLELIPNYLDKKYTIDVSSICNIKKDSSGKAILEVFDNTLHYLQALGVKSSEILSFSDASFKYHVNNIEKYKEYVNCGKIIEMPAGIKADKAIIAYCLNHADAVIISQDLFREYYKFMPNHTWIVERRICVVIVNNDIYLIPMIDSMKILEKKSISKSISLPIDEENEEKYTRTTLDVLLSIEKSEKEAKLNFY